MDACTLVSAHGCLKVSVGFSVHAYQCIHLCVHRVPVKLLAARVGDLSVFDLLLISREQWTFGQGRLSALELLISSYIE